VHLTVAVDPGRRLAVVVGANIHGGLPIEIARKKDHVVGAPCQTAHRQEGRVIGACPTGKYCARVCRTAHRDQVGGRRRPAPGCPGSQLCACPDVLAGRPTHSRRQSEEGWGAKVSDRLSVDLRTEFPGMRGLSTRNLVYMRTFAAAYPDGIAQQSAAQLPWRHIMVLLDKVPDPTVRDWYAAQDVQHGWSSAVLSHHITTGRHSRVGAAPNNFPQVIPAAESDQTREILQQRLSIQR
jgi:predicted nuclease of restriction endonuclease-like (RecB) superfamily